MNQPKNARRARPNMPHYGVMPEETDGMLTWDWVERHMSEARNYWIATTRADGAPHAVPVWGAWVNSALYFGTGKQSVKARNIRRDNRAVVHLESGDDTVIFEGVLVEANVTAEVLTAINDIYIKKYELDLQLEEDEDALLYRLVPHKVMAWREKDYPASATFWHFSQVADQCA